MANTRRRVVFIGAAGEMCRLAIERFAVAAGDWELALYDIRPELLEPLIRSCRVGWRQQPGSTCTTAKACTPPSTARHSSCSAPARTTAPQVR